MGVILTTTILTAAMVATLALRIDFSVYPSLRMILELGVGAVLATTAIGLAIRPLQRAPLPPSLLRVAILVLVCFPVVLVLLPMAHSAHPASLLGAGDDFWPAALTCFAVGSTLAVPTLGLLMFTSRRHSALEAIVLMALASALSGYIAIYMHCPMTSPLHLAGGHASITIAFLSVSGVVVLWLRNRG